MRFRKHAVWMAVAAAQACSAWALADSGDPSSRALDPAVIAADDQAASDALLMMGLQKAGAGQSLKDARISIYGWIESGYTYNHRHSSVNSSPDAGLSGSTLITPGPFNHEYGNHYMLNQVDLRFERQVDPKKFELGGMVEVLYGSDAARIHASGLGYNGSDATDDDTPADSLAVANLQPKWQFDIPQAYVDIGVPIGNGLKVRVGKFVTLLGYETIDPITNPFYSHSYLFSAAPFTHVGVMGDYKINDTWELQLGITRGWDIALEDNNDCAVDVLGQVAWKFDPATNILLNFSVGPENGASPAGGQKHDEGHYRVVLDPVIYWQVTKELKIGSEDYYLYDGGINGNGVDDTHHYGDVWGDALYAAYTANDMLTFNARIEKTRVNLRSFAGLSSATLAQPISLYEATLGVTYTPLPKDKYLKGLSVRPEIRYDYTDSSRGAFISHGGTSFKDQLTFAADVIFQF